MKKMVFETEGAPTLSVTECLRDLVIRGWDKPTVQLRSDADQLEARQEGDTIMIRCPDDLRVYVPFDTSLQVQKASGDARVKRVMGRIAIDTIHGDLVLSQVGPVEIGNVLGDLSARVIEGDLIVGSVSGDMSARSVSGRFQTGEIGRDLGLRDLMDDASATNVRGDIRLRTRLRPMGQYAFKASGDVVVRVPADTNADLTLRSGRGNIRVKADLANPGRTEHEITGRLGGGGATVVLEADRDLVLVARGAAPEWDWGDLGDDAAGLAMGAEMGMEFAGLADEIAAQIDTQMEEMSAQLEVKLANLEVDMAAIDQRAARAAERAARQAQEQVEKAAQRLRRKAESEAEDARRKARRAQRKGAASGHRRPAPPEPAAEPVTDDERLAILNMVAEGKITVEEAEKLLEALSE